MPKRNGEIRICIDYRELNKRTEQNSYPLPLPNEVQDRWGMHKYLLSWTVGKRFWQVPIAPEDQEKQPSHLV